MRMEFSKFMKKLKPYLAVILLQFGYAGNDIILKSALNNGMNHYTFIVYRNAIAAISFAPFALVFDRKKRPKMTLSIMIKIIILGLIEPVMDQNLYCIGMKATTATFTAAMYNLLPAITFLLAWALRLETVNIKSLYSHIKIVGILVSIGGAMIITLVKGPPIGLPWTKAQQDSQIVDNVEAQQPIKGALVLTAGCFCWSLFYILQANTLKSYPTGLTLTTLICAAGSIQGALFTSIVERGNKNIWFTGWNSKLLACAYSGIVVSGVAYYISGIVMKEKGPVFVTSFNPLTMVIVAVMSSFILAEQLNVGKVTGGIVIVSGLYLVLWAKIKDVSEMHCLESEEAGDKISTTNSSLEA